MAFSNVSRLFQTTKAEPPAHDMASSHSLMASSHIIMASSHSGAASCPPGNLAGDHVGEPFPVHVRDCGRSPKRFKGGAEVKTEVKMEVTDEVKTEEHRREDTGVGAPMEAASQLGGKWQGCLCKGDCSTKGICWRRVHLRIKPP